MLSTSLKQLSKNLITRQIYPAYNSILLKSFYSTSPAQTSESNAKEAYQSFIQYYRKPKRLTKKQRKMLLQEEHTKYNTSVEDITLNNLRDNPGAKIPVC